MDRIDFHVKIKEFLRKYKFALLILCAGIFLMVIPERQPVITQEEPKEVHQEQTPSQRLEKILSHIDGVGKVKVLLTESSAAETIYQTDDDITDSDNSNRVRHETVIISGSNREEVGLITTVKAPVYLGAIIVCQGGDLANIKLSVVQAVSNVTGISSDRISVLKMK